LETAKKVYPESWRESLLTPDAGRRKISLPERVSKREGTEQLKSQLEKNLTIGRRLR